MRGLGILRVEAAAILDHDGTVYSVPRPGRHHDVIRLMAGIGCPTPITGAQGFLLSNGKFCGRIPAKFLAKEAGQLLAGASTRKELFSEDVW